MLVTLATSGVQPSLADSSVIKRNFLAPLPHPPHLSHKFFLDSGGILLLSLPHYPRSSSLPQRGHGCVLWPPTWPRHPSPSRASSTWWTVGRSRSDTMTVSPVCRPSESPGCHRPQPISGRAERVGRSQATATGGLPWACPVTLGVTVQQRVLSHWRRSSGGSAGPRWPSDTCVLSLI